VPPPRGRATSRHTALNSLKTTNLRVTGGRCGTLARMKCRATVAALVSALVLAPFLAGGQQQYANPPVLRAATHLVHINVIATDKSGHPVTDLTRNDFVIKDRGQMQKIGLFSMDAVNTASQPHQVLPRNIFSDQPQYNGRSPNGVTIILLDHLNTLTGSAPTPYETTPFWLEDHALANAKQHLMEFVKQLQPNDRIAIYGLTDRLHVLCDFTCGRRAAFGRGEQVRRDVAHAARNHRARTLRYWSSRHPRRLQFTPG
jgi:hypothetical protein